jgi:tetratricopeptide (TPR) repeat protein
MGKIVGFPAEASKNLGFERVRSTYTAREIRVQFGISHRFVERWTREGLLPSIPNPKGGDPLYDFRALSYFRRIRELRSRGLSLKQIDYELHGQMNLFPEPPGTIIPIPKQLSAFEEALLLHERGDPRAPEYYCKAIEEKEFVEDAYCNLGIFEFESGNIARAFDCFTQALKTDPRHFEAHYNLAYLYFENGDLRLARIHYEIAGEIDPAVSGVYFNLGLVNAMTGDLTAAAAALCYAKSIATEEEEPRINDLLNGIRNALQPSVGPPSREAGIRKSLHEVGRNPSPGGKHPQNQS